MQLLFLDRFSEPLSVVIVVQGRSPGVKVLEDGISAGKVAMGYGYSEVAPRRMFLIL